MSSYERLRESRAAFKEFYEKTVAPSLKLEPNERDTLSDEEIATRIGDAAIRRRYCELAIDMLDANIEHHGADAQLLEPTGRDDLTPVVSTLVIAALVNHLAGLSAAMLAAAGWYWLAHHTCRRRHAERARQRREHNGMASEWRETLEGWEQSKAALREMIGRTPEVNP